MVSRHRIYFSNALSCCCCCQPSANFLHPGWKVFVAAVLIKKALTIFLYLILLHMSPIAVFLTCWALAAYHFSVVSQEMSLVSLKNCRKKITQKPARHFLQHWVCTAVYTIPREIPFELKRNGCWLKPTFFLGYWEWRYFNFDIIMSRFFF